MMRIKMKDRALDLLLKELGVILFTSRNAEIKIVKEDDVYRISGSYDFLEMSEGQDGQIKMFFYSTYADKPDQHLPIQERNETGFSQAWIRCSNYTGRIIRHENSA